MDGFEALRSYRPPARDDWAGQLREFAGQTEALCEQIRLARKHSTHNPDFAESARERWVEARRIVAGANLADEDFPPDRPNISTLADYENALIGRDGLAAWARRVALRLTERMCTPAIEVNAPETRQRTGQQTREEQVRAALAALVTIGPNASRIAQTIGVPVGTLRGWPTFMEHYERARQEAERNRNSRRGRHTASADFESDEE